MKKAIVVSTLVICVLCYTVSYAHPPSDITISYDTQTKTVKAVIVHPVNNVESHYINKVDVGLNGKEVIEHTISRQDSSQEQVVMYRIPDAKKGDTISVEGYCSISGKLTKQIKIEE